ncbi:hypothetical protein CA265_13340 [Sphingobacteriaceae bacterium GW460-11-11-14-LB5]|nr:hypothetical protein CA265_13340 [Sphingobacteriaceae bacterium GW460-11-11-14-LB5]
MKKQLLMALAAVGIFCASSCKRTEIPVAETNSTFKSNPQMTVSNPVISHNRNLTVVYLVPTDLDTLANFRSRVDGVLTWIQNYYAQELNRNGYGLKTFGLVKDTTTQLVQINVIRSTQSKTNFNSGLGVTEVDNFFTAHPGLKQSQHVLILLPPFTTNANGEPAGGNPFYGYGKYCYALDYAGFNIANIGTEPFTKWIGGLAHEMGHALNSSHNRESVSQKNSLGTSLMGSGNYTLGKTPTFISAADAAIFNNNEVFNNNSSTYYGSVSTTIPRIYASYSAAQSAIVCSGKFTSTGTVDKVLYFNDPNVGNEGTGVNHDYNAITWASSKIGTDSFSVVMPISEFWVKTDGIPYELKVKFVHTNGTITEHIYYYTFQGGIPVINFGYRPELSKTGWTIDGFSSQETGENGYATNVLDNNSTTFWHSKWSSSPAGTYPHFISVNLGSNKTASGIALQHRSGSRRAIKDFEILTSTDGISYTSRGNFSTVKTDGKQYFAFGSALTFQYLKIVANTSWDGTQFAAIAELGLY